MVDNRNVSSFQFVGLMYLTNFCLQAKLAILYMHIRFIIWNERPISSMDYFILMTCVDIWFNVIFDDIFMLIYRSISYQIYLTVNLKPLRIILQFDCQKSIIEMNHVCLHIFHYIDRIWLPVVLSIYDWKHRLLIMSKKWFILWVPWSNPSILNNDFLLI